MMDLFDMSTRIPPKYLNNCESCGKSSMDAKLLKCARCMNAKYCSTECQKTDWKIHKPRCNAILKTAEMAKEGNMDVALNELRQWTAYVRPLLQEGSRHGLLSDTQPRQLLGVSHWMFIIINRREGETNKKRLFTIKDAKRVPRAMANHMVEMLVGKDRAPEMLEGIDAQLRQVEKKRVETPLDGVLLHTILFASDSGLLWSIPFLAEFDTKNERHDTQWLERMKLAIDSMGLYGRK